MVETGFPVCPTCSLWGLHPKSETGLEHAVAALSVFAKSSIIFQFSGPFIPLPAETTISASSILTEPLESSTDSKTIPDSMKSFSMFSIIGSDLFLFTPNEFLEMLKILISEFILISQKALLEKVLLFTINGDKEDGIETTLEIKAALIFTDKSEAKYLQFTLSEIIIFLAPVLFETLEINSA